MKTIVDVCKAVGMMGVGILFCVLVALAVLIAIPPLICMMLYYIGLGAISLVEGAICDESLQTRRW